MAKIKAFPGYRPPSELAAQVASLPYDVMNRAEAQAMVADNPQSFLHVVRAEIDLPAAIDAYDDRVYAQSKATLERFIAEGTLQRDPEPKLYIYRQLMNGRVQTGLVALASIDEYLDGRIKKHELTREAKEQDRIKHFDSCDANTGLVFLTYRRNDNINRIIQDFIKFHQPEAEFRSSDGILHLTWKIDEADIIAAILAEFAQVEALYIADGHHRSASAAKVGLKRRAAAAQEDPEALYNYFMSVIFPDEDLFIMDYNRVVQDLNGHSEAELLALIAENFTVTKLEGSSPYKPRQKGCYGMYLGASWYELKAKAELFATADPVERLDVQILQKYVLDPLLAIKDPRTDQRIDFVGGVRGLEELVRRVQSDMKVAFALYPTSMDELLSIADSGAIMPPKSTWFEPKLRSGLFVHKLS